MKKLPKNSWRYKQREKGYENNLDCGILIKSHNNLYCGVLIKCHNLNHFIP